MATVNPKHYYLKIEEYGRIIDALEADYAGMSCSKIPEIKKRAWDANFKLYRETESILKRAADPEDFTYFPLYRSIGKDPEDFEFNSREEALKEYEYQIGDEVFCYQNDC